MYMFQQVNRALTVLSEVLDSTYVQELKDFKQGGMK